MNPIALVAMALVGLLAVYLFIGQSDQQHSEQAAKEAVHQLDKAKFDKDFAAGWNGDKVAAPPAGEIEAKAAKLAQLEAEAEKKRQEAEKRTKEMQKGLDDMSGYKDGKK